ncbi:MAG: hypothetical protein ACO1OO_08105 [Flavisolibacter sp.]
MDEEKMKKEQSTGEGADREEKREQENKVFTHVKNAHAAGDGSLEKSDELLTKTKNEKSGDHY